MRKKLFISVFMLLVGITTYAQAVIYWSATGKDTYDGKTPDTPWKSISKVLSNLTPGTTVYVMPGEYTSAIELEKKHSGTQNAYVTFKAYDMQNRPHIKYGGSGKWNCINIQASYVVIDGLHIEGHNQNYDLTSAKTDSVAAYQYSKTYHDNGSTGYDWNGCAKYNTNGISIGKGGKDGGFPHHVEIRNCIVHDFPGGGIGSQQSDYLTIENNIVYNNAWYCMYACSGISILTPYNSDNEKGYKMFVTGNIVYNNHTKIPWSTTNFRHSDGNGIIIDVNLTPDGSSTDAIKADGAYRAKTLVANNVSYFNGGSGIHAFKAANVDIINNSSYHNEQRYNGSYGEIFSQSGQNNRIVNNIMYARANHKCNNYVDASVTYTNNIYCGGTYTRAGQSNQYKNIANLPMYVKNPAVFGDSADLHLATGSPAVGFATYMDFMPTTDIEGTERPTTGIDCGAYVYKNTSAVDTPFADNNTTSGRSYNLNGQEIQPSYKGIIISGGKKYIKN